MSSKIAQPLVKFTEIIRDNDLVFDEELSRHNYVVKRFISLVNKVPDSRRQKKIVYPMKEILLIAFFAVLSGAQTWTQIAMYGAQEHSWLRNFLKFENGTPSHDTFRRVFSLIKPEILQTLTVDFLMNNMKQIKKALGIEDVGMNLINVDGKQSTGTGKTSSKNGPIADIQILNVYDASHGICIAMKDIDEKSNEIPAAQKILRTLNLKNSVVTFDALNTQKKTIAVITEQGGDYVGALKANHQLFYNEVKDYFSPDVLDKLRECGDTFYQTVEVARKRKVCRNYYMTTDIKWFSDRSAWKKLKAFVCCEKTTTNLVTGETTTEMRYYISSVADVQLCGEAIRGHWSVENKLHWHIDVSFGDDDDTTSDKNAFMNFTQFRRLALTLLKMAQPILKCSIKNMQWLSAMRPERNFGKMLNALDEKQLEEALRNAIVKK